MAVIDVFAYNHLSLSQAVDTNIKIEHVQQFLKLDDHFKINLKVRHVESQLYLSHSATATKITNVNVEHTLTFVHGTLPRVLVEAVEHRLLLSQDAQAVANWPDVRQSLDLQQTVDVEVAKGVYSVLNLTHEATYTITRNLSVEHTLTLVSQAAGYLPSKYWTSFDVVLEEPP